MNTQLRVKVLDVGHGDAHKGSLKQIIGETGYITSITSIWGDGHIACDMTINDEEFVFYRVKVTSIRNEW